jgi:hypothetical protein
VADDPTVNGASPTATFRSSADEITSVNGGALGYSAFAQRIKIDWKGVDGELWDVSRAAPLPVGKGHQTVTACLIANTNSLSGAIDLDIYRLVGIAIPATFEPTQLTFQSSYDNATWNNVYDASGAEKIVAVGVSRRVIIQPNEFFGIRYLKVRGGTSGTPTVVAADRTLQLIAEA